MAKKNKLAKKKRVVIVEVNMRFAVELGTAYTASDRFEGFDDGLVPDPCLLAEAASEVVKGIKLDLVAGIELVHSLTSAQPE